MATSKKQARKTAIEQADAELLATLGYKQEFQRAFTGLEVSRTRRIIRACTQIPLAPIEDAVPLPRCCPVGLRASRFVCAVEADRMRGLDFRDRVQYHRTAPFHCVRAFLLRPEWRSCGNGVGCKCLTSHFLCIRLIDLTLVGCCQHLHPVCRDVHG